MVNRLCRTAVDFVKHGTVEFGMHLWWLSSLTAPAESRVSQSSLSRRVSSQVWKLQGWNGTEFQNQAWQDPAHPCVSSNALLWVQRWGVEEVSEDLQRSFQMKLLYCPVCTERSGTDLQNTCCGCLNYKSCFSGLCWTKWIWPNNSTTDLS